MNQDTPTNQVRSGNDGWIHGSSFLSSILSGALLGYLADLWLGTAPWLVVIGIIAGSYSGFMKMWHYAKETDETSTTR